MAIDTSKLVQAPILQQYFVDKTSGFPLAGGIVTLYQDNARTTLKNWYYQTGSPGTYTYQVLDNPMHLSSVGTPTDPNGNDIIPFYYPFDENDSALSQPYFVTVDSVDENGNPAQRQFTRENFPFEPQGSPLPPSILNPTNKNYIINNVFWRNVGNVNVSTELNKVLAPDQHDSLRMPDIRFIKNISGATDNIAFVPFIQSSPSQVLKDTITPESYLNFQCTALQLGETQKLIQFPISTHVNTLASVPATLFISGQNNGSPNNFIDISILQDYGSGAVSPAPFLVQRIFLGTTWEPHIVQFTFPTYVAQTLLGNGGDDGLYLQIGLPLSAVCNFNIAKPLIYLSSAAKIPTNDFDTYDQIDTVINSPRTGDIKISLNAFSPFGYVPANDGSIGDPTSSATTRANKDTWPLYNLIWNNVLDTFAPVSSGRGSSAIADFNAHKKLTLTRTLGRVIAGLNASVITTAIASADPATDQLTVTSNTFLLTGTPILLTGGSLPPPLVINTVYYVINVSSTIIKLATTLDNAYAGTAIDITATGTGNIIDALGVYTGESAHALTIAELPAHTHPPAAGVGHSFISNNAGSGSTSGGGDLGTTNQTGSTGGGIAHSVFQPTVFYNVLFKL